MTPWLLRQCHDSDSAPYSAIERAFIDVHGDLLVAARMARRPAEGIARHQDNVTSSSLVRPGQSTATVTLDAPTRPVDSIKGQG